MTPDETAADDPAPRSGNALGGLQRDGAIGKYRINRQIGQGGMGVVFHAHDPTLQRDVAIKVLGSSGTQEPTYVQLLREARSASALNHPNICTVYEVGEDRGWGFIAMEYVEGRPLAELVDGSALAAEAALRYGIDTADALAHAHDRGVVHRDLKAANIIISTTGRLKIVDFGLARRTDARLSNVTTLATIAAPPAVAGTPYAMAPEQVRGLVADARSDIWALGVLLYEMLSGRRPFHGDTVAELFSSVLRDSPAFLPLDTPDSLRECVLKCLAKDPEMRYQRAADVRSALEATAVGAVGRPVADGLKAAPGSPLPPSPLLNIPVSAVSFVGREAELARITEVWERTKSGQRQLVLVAGEPGIGKTRLSLEFGRRCADSGATVVVGRSDEEALVPYQPFVEALSWYARTCPEAELRAQLVALGGGGELGSLIPDLLRRVANLPAQQPMNAEGQRYRLFEAVTRLLSEASTAHPMLVVLDDLHWADKPTLLMLRHVVRASDPASLCIIGTYRVSEVHGAHPLAELLADLRRDQTLTRLSLGGLDEAHVRGMVGEFAGADLPPQLAHLIAEGTDGNPFFVGEMLRHLKETGALGRLVADLGVPEGIREVIGRRLSRLTEACHRTLTLAAVIGREFDLDILETLGDLPELELLDAIDEARRAQLVAEAPVGHARFSFMHALIRETLYEELASTRRVRLHRRVGEAMERLAEKRSSPPLADLAYHFVQAAPAGTVDKAVDYAARAGDRAADALAHEEAARFYQMALQALELKPAGPEVEARRADLHARRARAFGAIAQWTLEKAEVELALQHVNPAEIERRCELVQEMAGAAFYLLDSAETERLATQALNLAEQVNRPDIAAKALSWLGACRQAGGDLEGAIESYRTAIVRAGNAETEIYPIGPLSLYLAGRPAEAIAFGSRAADLARRSRDAVFVMYSLSHYALSLVGAGRYREGANVFDEVREFGRKYGVLPLLARATAMSAGFHLSIFDFQGAEALQLEARELARSVAWAPPVVSAGIDLLLTLARRHEPGSAEKLLRETADTAASTAGWHAWLWELRLSQARAELALARGDFDLAIREATDGIDQSRTKRRPKYEALELITRTHALHSLGRTYDAIVDARLAISAAHRTEDPALLLLALDAVISIDGDDAAAAEARRVRDRILVALPDEQTKRRFSESEVVQRLAHLS